MPDIDEIQEEATQRSLDKVQDDAASDDAVPPVRYEVASFGIDYDVEGIVRRLKRGDMLIPSFQRTYISKLPEASRFIESLLLGLPIPGVFLAEEPGTNRLLVIDGQQRLKTRLLQRPKRCENELLIGVASYGRAQTTPPNLT